VKDEKGWIAGVLVAVMLVVGSLAIIGCIQPRTLEELEPEGEK